MKTLTNLKGTTFGLNNYPLKILGLSRNTSDFRL